MGRATPGQVVLGYIREEVEQAMGSKPVMQIPPRSLLQFQIPGSYLELLPMLSLAMDCGLEV